ncbi:MAG: DUF1569 domain-containing protein [Crocinitomicaceae bacterium]|nr:DUF1569 domain-containing protein [Crocinitomicaceae bacterium]
MNKQSTEKLLKQVQELESSISHFDSKQESVSKVPIAWHLEHIMLVINGVIGTMVLSDPKDFNPKFNAKKKLFFAIGKFPKGRARAPKSVTPKTEITEERLRDHISKTKHQTAKLSSLPEKAFFKHAIFGELHLNDSIRFLEMHNEHHLKIVRSIKQADK